MWQKLKDFCAKAKKWIIYTVIVGVAVAIIILYHRFKDVLFGGLQKETDKLRKAKEKSDAERNQTYTATNTETRDNTQIAPTNSTTQDLANDLIAQNKAYLEKLAQEKK